MVGIMVAIMQEKHNGSLSISLVDLTFFLYFIFLSLLFFYEVGNGVKKAIKKVASGLVGDAEKSWFAELSDKGKMNEIYRRNCAL